MSHRRSSVVLTRDAIKNGFIDRMIDARGGLPGRWSERQIVDCYRAMLAKAPPGDIWMQLGRGSPECPGLMLGLVPGGACAGVALRIERAAAATEFDILFRREMVSGSYDPRWVTVQIDGIAGPRKALCFLMNRAHERYAGRLSDATVADAIAHAAGPLGACRDYLDHTVAALGALGIDDKPLARMQKMVQARVAAAG
jgi:cation transport protein ChaC